MDASGSLCYRMQLTPFRIFRSSGSCILAIKPYTLPQITHQQVTQADTHTHEKCLRSSMCDSCNTCSIPLAVSSTIPSNPPKPGVVSELKLLHTINGGIWLCSSWDACVLVAMPETTFQSCLWASLSLAA